MTKIETFRWRMWHVYLLIFITILLTGTFVRYGYRLQAAYSLDDRLYDFTNKKVPFKTSKLETLTFQVLSLEMKKHWREVNQPSVAPIQPSKNLGIKHLNTRRTLKIMILSTIISLVKILEKDTLLMYQTLLKNQDTMIPVPWIIPCTPMVGMSL